VINVAIDNQTTIAQSDRFTTTVSCQPLAVRASSFTFTTRREISSRRDYAKFFNRSHDVLIRVYDPAGNVIETHEHKGDFKEP
jgi:hypothetical protein